MAERKAERERERGRESRFKGVSIKATAVASGPETFTRLQLYTFNRKWPPRATAFKLRMRTLIN